MIEMGLLISGVLARTLWAASEPLASVPYGIGDWTQENLGNHRARVLVHGPADAVRVRIPWRRRDVAPEEKQTIVVDATTGERVLNLVRLAIHREYGDLVFQPVTAPGEYHVYYLPHENQGWAHMPTANYPEPVSEADPQWAAQQVLNSPTDWEGLPEAKVLEIQSRNAFHRFDPMEVIATSAEVADLLDQHSGQSYLLFPESREQSIRMVRDLPYRWIETGPRNVFEGEARQGEFYVFQIGLYAAQADLDGINVTFGELCSDAGEVLPADAFRCFNEGGTDWLGRPFVKNVSVPQGHALALWCGMQIPLDARQGQYRGELTVQPRGGDSAAVKLNLAVLPQQIDDSGDNDLWRLARLRWLDSTIGIDDEVVAPYTPMQVRGESIGCLNREVRPDSTGLPASIRSSNRELLAAPIQMAVETSAGLAEWTGGEVQITKQMPGIVAWQAESSTDIMLMRCEAALECDGYLNVRITLQASEAMTVEDIRLEIPMSQQVALYMMGMGCKGGLRPESWRWVWDEDYANHSVWLGDVDAGLHCKLKGPDDTWDLYNLKTSGVPESWGNRGRGGCDVTEQDGVVRLSAYTGPRELSKGQVLEFRFGLLITPVKPLDSEHWNQRYYHDYVPVDTVVENGANIVNIHHGNDLNPNINYPFVAIDQLRTYVQEAHEKGVKVKLYYTVRELSNYVAEIWALRSLGDEIFTDGSGGGDSWLQEHLVDHYASAWHHPFAPGEVDAAIATTGLSRWHNYYLEGLRWLLRHVEIDGLYLDGIGYDREIMKRVRKVLEHERPGCLIDFHSGNNFHPQYGLSNCANQYMEHFPFVDSLWFGEGFDYDESPDYWLVEISGIPFGLYGEMLQGNGNPWRGMVYGMTARYYSGADPKHIWQLWDTFGIQDSEMIGYWATDCPVQTDHPQVLATVYRRAARSLIAVASWASDPVECRLELDWSALGLDPDRATLHAPKVTGFQQESQFRPSDGIPIQPGQGWLLVLSESHVGMGASR